jgi:hypothetical protein
LWVYWAKVDKIKPRNIARISTVLRLTKNAAMDAIDALIRTVICIITQKLSRTPSKVLEFRSSS